MLFSLFSIKKSDEKIQGEKDNKDKKSQYENRKKE